MKRMPVEGKVLLINQQDSNDYEITGLRLSKIQIERNDHMETAAKQDTVSKSELIEMLEDERKSQRYPYTFAADYLRLKVGNDYGKGLISRAAASHIQSLIAEATGINKEEISKALAEKYLIESGSP